ncbi:hypothetical protein JOD63_001920 [Microbacterium terrae]|uniref:DUF4350 domain-containing protein n=1 Tax=Microbacterium terrae TaxID=69369 RepID=A0A0M2HC28_9MICO|nr:DUF4350 domain-containing protein [Microbacterium terrae]KJL41757.1 hypothetical protein RS81_01342 [Microbacterium terrae]MBP1077952.1 hypothetical protein [Microbacterium terrae]GLK00124.1 hypothetical protein GCM10017594_33210 [Microbacterium terrae]
MSFAAPPTKSRTRGVAAWIGIAVVLLAVGAVGAVITQAAEWAERGSLDPESAGPTGTRALVEVLRDHGVEVVVARDRAAASAALAGGTATLVLPDAPALSDDAIEALAADATDVVLIDPRARTLDLFFPGAEPAGVAGVAEVDPACADDTAVRAGAVAPGAVFRPAGGDIVRCYPSGDAFGMLADDSVAALDATVVFTNEHLATGGNAALAIGLLGEHPRVVWYVPGLLDTDLENADPSLGELTPPWVSPVIVLLLVAGVAAAIHRGRRFGPLVAERLPVTVRAAETTEGRAHLYARARDAVHAADQLRLGSLTRIGALVGLGATASATEIADAAAAVTGRDRRVVRGILIDDLPRGDGDLVALAQRIRQLEDAVRAAIRPEGHPQ